MKKVIIDFSHPSVKTIDDVLALSTRPIIVSHIGVKGTVNDNRNISDDQLRRLSAKGGLIGLGLWEEAIVPITNLDTSCIVLLHKHSSKTVLQNLK